MQVCSNQTSDRARILLQDMSEGGPRVKQVHEFGCGMCMALQVVQLGIRYGHAGRQYD